MCTYIFNECTPIGNSNLSLQSAFDQVARHLLQAQKVLGFEFAVLVSVKKLNRIANELFMYPICFQSLWVERLKNYKREGTSVVNQGYLCKLILSHKSCLLFIQGGEEFDQFLVSLLWREAVLTGERVAMEGRERREKREGSLHCGSSCLVRILKRFAATALKRSYFYVRCEAKM